MLIERADDENVDQILAQFK
jgi:golgin subfamily B member 1